MITHCNNGVVYEIHVDMAEARRPAAWILARLWQLQQTAGTACGAQEANMIQHLPIYDAVGSAGLHIPARLATGEASTAPGILLSLGRARFPLNAPAQGEGRWSA